MHGLGRLRREILRRRRLQQRRADDERLHGLGRLRREGGGGGVFNSGTLALSGCTVSGNSALNGGGVYNRGTLTLSGCTVTGDSAFNGGGVENGGTLTLSGCTVTGDSAGFFGGGVENFGTLTMSGCTVTGDSAGGGGGLYNTATGTVALNSTIVANSLGGGDIVNNGVLTGSHDLIGDGSGGIVGTGNLLGTVANPINPLLAPLGNYGGPTQTTALLPGSPAIDQGGAVAALTSAGVADPMSTAVTLASGSAFAATNLPAARLGRLLRDPGRFRADGRDRPDAQRRWHCHADGRPRGRRHERRHPRRQAPVLLASDQRGEPSVGGVDIGAFESQGFTLTPVSASSPQAVLINTNFANALAATVTANDSLEPVAGGVIDFSAYERCVGHAL